MRAWWVTFSPGGPPMQRLVGERDSEFRARILKAGVIAEGCVEAEDEAGARALALIMIGREAVACLPLFHPAEPRLNKYEDPVHGVMPSLCGQPTKCVVAGTCVASYPRAGRKGCDG